MNSEPLSKKETIALELFKVMMRDLDYNHPQLTDHINRIACMAAYQGSCLLNEVNRVSNATTVPDDSR